MRSSIRIVVCLAVLVAALALPTTARAAAMDATTPPQLVATYEDLADAILAVKQTERNLVESILAMTYGHAAAVYADTDAKLKAGQGATTQIETLAALVSQLGNEGDAAVAAIRKRLVEGGHIHHSSAEEQKVWDPGFVVVTKEAKKVFLDAAAAIGKMAAKPDAAALKAEWGKVAKQYAALNEAN